MYIIINTYVSDMPVIEDLLDEHLAWVKSNYEAGTFIASGRRQPWNGSVIFALSPDELTLRATLAEDPFARASAIETEIVAVDIARTAAGLQGLIG